MNKPLLVIGISWLIGCLIGYIITKSFLSLMITFGFGELIIILGLIFKEFGEK